jgi:hypothetical protein
VGHFHGKPGTLIHRGQYRIIRDVGMGTFGRVVQCERVRGGGHHHDDDNRGHSFDIIIVGSVTITIETLAVTTTPTMAIMTRTHHHRRRL